MPKIIKLRTTATLHHTQLQRALEEQKEAQKIIEELNKKTNKL